MPQFSSFLSPSSYLLPHLLLHLASFLHPSSYLLPLLFLHIFSFVPPAAYHPYAFPFIHSTTPLSSFSILSLSSTLHSSFISLQPFLPLSLSHFYYLLHSASFNHLSFIVRPSSLPPSSCPASFPVIITSLLFQFPPRSTSSHPLLASGTHQGDRRGKKKCWAIPEN